MKHEENAIKMYEQYIQLHHINFEVWADSIGWDTIVETSLKAE